MITIFCSNEREYNYLPDNAVLHADVIYVDGAVVKSKLAHFSPGKYEAPVEPPVEPPAPDPGPRVRTFCGDCGYKLVQRTPRYSAYDEYTGKLVKTSCGVCVTDDCPSKGVEK